MSLIFTRVAFFRRFGRGKSDKEVLDHLLTNTRYDKRLLPPVDGKYEAHRVFICLPICLTHNGDTDLSKSLFSAIIIVRIIIVILISYTINPRSKLSSFRFIICPNFCCFSIRLSSFKSFHLMWHERPIHLIESRRSERQRETKRLTRVVAYSGVC